MNKIDFILDNFDMLFNNEENIKKLESIILDLAVKGKLVKQDSSDEDSSILIKKIKKKKDKLIKEKKIRKPKKLEPISKEEIPFEIPSSWSWVRLGEVCNDIHYGYTDSAKQNNTGVKFLRITDIQNNTVNWNTVPYCNISDKKFLVNGINNLDILIARTGGTIGKSYLVENLTSKAVFASYLIRAIPVKKEISIYLKKFLETNTYWKQLLEKSQGTGQPNVNATSLKNLTLPLPPLNEQKRIVKRVESLKKLTESLKERTKERNKIRLSLKKSILSQIEKSNSNDELLDNLNLIFKNFDTIVEGKKDVKDIRDLILSMAVKGKLVKQDSSDEDSSILIKKIKKEKDKLIKEKKIRKPKKLEPISKEEIPFEIPTSWSWVCLGEIVTILGDGLHGTPQYSDNGEYYFINGNNLNNGVIEIKNNTKLVSHNEFIKYKKILTERTVLVSINGTLGNVSFYNNEKVVLGKSACYFNLFPKLSKSYIKSVINTKYFINYAFSKASGTTIKNLSLKSMNSFPIPLPPLNEQKRIVKRVESLMK